MKRLSLWPLGVKLYLSHLTLRLAEFAFKPTAANPLSSTNFDAEFLNGKLRCIIQHNQGHWEYHDHIMHVNNKTHTGLVWAQMILLQVERVSIDAYSKQFSEKA